MKLVIRPELSTLLENMEKSNQILLQPSSLNDSLNRRESKDSLPIKQESIWILSKSQCQLTPFGWFTKVLVVLEVNYGSNT